MLILAYGERLKEFFHKRKLLIGDKRAIADEVIRICVEGESSTWSKLPRELEHVLYVEHCLRGINEELAKEFKKLYGKWYDKALTILEGGKDNKDNTISNAQMLVHSKNIIDKANKIKFY